MAERSCVICRKKGPKERLIRFVLGAGEGGLEIDPLSVKPGRGVYTHAVLGCLFAKDVEQRLIGALERGSRTGRRVKVTKPQGGVSGSLAAGSNAGGSGAGEVSPGSLKRRRSESMAELIKRFLGAVSKSSGPRKRKGAAEWEHQLDLLLKSASAPAENRRTKSQIRL